MRISGQQIKLIVKDESPVAQAFWDSPEVREELTDLYEKALQEKYKAIFEGRKI